MALVSSLASLSLVLSAPLALGFVDRACRSATVQFPRNDARAIETSLFRPRRQSSGATSRPGGTATAIASGGGGGDDGWFDDYDDFVSGLDFDSGDWDRGADSPFEGGDDSSSYGGGRGSRGGRGRGRGGGRGGGGGRGREPFNSYGGGHDYVRDASDTTPVDVDAVNRLMADRLHYRKKRMFDLADGIRDELLSAHGVTVWDRERTWSADSRGGRPDRRGRGGRGDRGRGGGRGGRGSGRGRGRERQFNEHGHDYNQVGGPVNPDVCSLPESEIHDLIRTRMECKFERDFVQADDIEATLSGAGVEVHDGFKEWRADGDAWSRSNRNDNFRSRQSTRGPKEYTQRGVGLGLSEEQIETVTDLVRERSVAKADYDYPRADSIFDRLRSEFDVNVDDRAGEWAVLSEEYIMSESTAFVPEKSVQAEIGKKLGERVLARKRRDFDLADAIREELLTDYVVEIDDQTKEWTIVSPPDGASWSDDDDDEDVNVVSKEEWEEDDDDDEDNLDGDFDAVFEDDDGIETLPEEDGGADSPPNDQNLDEAQLTSMTVPQLKEKLREAGKPVSGRKSELIERLLS